MGRLATWTVALCLLPIGLAACSDKHPQQAQTAAPAAVKRWAPPDKPVDYPASLRAVLPPDAVAYLRIPDPWGLLGAPKGDALATALDTQPNAAIIEQLRRALHDNVLSKLGPGADLYASLLLYQIRSPIEIAVLAPTQHAGPPSALLSVRLAAHNEDQVNALLQQLAQASPALRLMRPLAPGKTGLLAVGPSLLHVAYDGPSSTVRLLVGPQVTDAAFERVLQSLVPAKNHPMYAFEDQIDRSHRGFFEWADTKRLLPLLSATMPPDKLQELERSGVMDISEMALGWGVVDGKGRLKWMAKVSGADFNRYFSNVPDKIALTSAGTPTTVASLALPDAQQLDHMEQFLRQHAQPATYHGYQLAKQRFQKALGLSYEDVLKALGPEMMVFSDRVGEFGAIKIRDRAALQRLLDALTHLPNSHYVVKKLGGHTFHHLTLPPLWTPGPRAARVPLPVRLWSKGKSHIYWVEDDGYLVLAGVPQLLEDRMAYGDRQSIGTWLSTHQHQDVHASVLSVSTTIQDSPRRLYYAYLSFLELLGDVAGDQVDLFSMPTAAQLQLPARGTYGAQLDARGNTLAVQLTFENNPAEIFLGQNVAGVAVVGVLAAIAIPAYHDYTLRATVAGAIGRTQGLRSAVAGFHARRGRFPNAGELNALSLAPWKGGAVRSLAVAPDSGAITITLGGDRLLAGRHIVFTPQVNSTGTVSWRCASDLPRKTRPPTCR
jgi:Tfp pilus assembly major pilin PilA